jgi:hypothetical protein
MPRADPPRTLPHRQEPPPSDPGRRSCSVRFGPLARHSAICFLSPRIPDSSQRCKIDTVPRSLENPPELKCGSASRDLRSPRVTPELWDSAAS